MTLLLPITIKYITFIESQIQLLCQKSRRLQIKLVHCRSQHNFVIIIEFFSFLRGDNWKLWKKPHRIEKRLSNNLNPQYMVLRMALVESKFSHHWLPTKIIAYQFCNPVLQTNSQEELLNAITKCDSSQILNALSKSVFLILNIPRT